MNISRDLADSNFTPAHMDCKLIHIDETDSTNRYCKDCVLLHPKENLLVATDYQTAGKGCGTNHWESERDQNLLFSLLWHPDGLKAGRQFYISMAVSQALKSVVSRYCRDEVKVKWPNDIYVGDRKICGILIENQLKGDSIKQSIIGIGLNVNQTRFVSDAPNPVSLAQLTGQELDREQLLRELAQSLGHHLDMLGSASAEHALYEDYLDSLYRVHKDCLYRFPDGTERECRLEVVYEDGRMALSWQTEKESQTDRQVGIFAFKEVQFVI